MTPGEALALLQRAELIFSEADIEAAIQRMGRHISAAFSGQDLLVLSVMGGAVVFTGHLLPRLTLPLDFDYIHVSRYGHAQQGGTLAWKVPPDEKVKGRVVLVLDDVLDEGHTLAAIKAKILDLGAAACFSAVMVDKDLGRDKPVVADYVGLHAPNRFLLGYGMDVEGYWRNLPAIYALPAL